MFDNNAKEVVSGTLRSHLDRTADWLRKPGFPPVLYSTIRTNLEHENANIMEGIDVVHERGVEQLFGFRVEEEGIAMYFSILPGESWEDARRFYASLPSSNGKPYLSWITRQLEAAHQAVDMGMYTRQLGASHPVADLNWLAHWVILVRPLRSKPDSFWFNVAFSVAGRSEKRLPKVQLYVHCSDLLNPEELESLAELQRQHAGQGLKPEKLSWVKRLFWK